tara:strand:+ start:460 stop:858 length:399 start_codon:yes stop_codon:yes gene_type:complete
MGHNDSSRIYELSKKVDQVLKETDSIKTRIGHNYYKLGEIENDLLRTMLYHLENIQREGKYGKPLERIHDAAFGGIENLEEFVKREPQFAEHPNLRLALSHLSSIYAVAYRYLNEQTDDDETARLIEKTREL